MAVSWGGIAGEQVRRLERAQRQQAGAVQNADAYQFIVSPTCPPSTSVVFRGGLAWWAAWNAYPSGYYIPGYTVDLTDSDKAYPSYTFTNAFWYSPRLVVMRSSSFWPPPEPPATWPTDAPDDTLYLYGTGEFATVADAEVACRNMRGDTASQSGIVMGGLILRNNGNTTDPNQYQPIDRVNRGRSYLFGGKRYGWEMG